MGRGTSRSYPVVWQISALQLVNKRTLIAGVLLTKVPYDVNRKSNTFRNLVNIIRTYFINTYANKSITLIANSISTKTRTDDRGSFRIIADYQLKGEIEIFIPNRTSPLKIIQSYPVIHKTTHPVLGIISDIDDTVVESFSVSFFKRIAVILFKTPKQRNPISFTNKLFKAYNKQKVNIYYVSKSEGNLFGNLTNFIEHSGLPKGLLILTPYLTLWRLLSTKKAVDFKLNNIRFILENTDEQEYILFGDDGQRDMEIYTEIAKIFPKKVREIYIRQTKVKINFSKKQGIEKLRNTGVPVKYFKSDDIIEKPDKLLIKKL